MHMRHDPAAPAAATIAFDDFLKIDVRVGMVLTAEPLEDARKPSFKLQIDFGPAVGIRKSCAQLTENYTPEALIGRQVLAVVNFAPRQIGKAISEVLTLGVPDETGAVVLIAPDRPVFNGERLF